ncbi:MAG: DNA methyltransferase, partial [Bacteriovoracales bacterium]|nr:DNA methyltransferase [Bacteriovoracales bacterium]
MNVIHNVDCLKGLKKIPSASIDSIVTDPPYGISILSEKWDKAMPKTAIWKECFRVLKPGGYILAFSSAGLYHHLAIAMEEIGFETQNMVVWLYGNGFPRGSNLSMQFDRTDKMPRPDDAFRQYLKEAV